MIRSVRSDIEIFAKENVFIKDEFYIAISGKKKKPLFCPMLTLNIKSTNLTANLCENIKIRFSGTFTKPLIRQCNSLTQHCGQLDIVCKTVKFTICSAYFSFRSGLKSVALFVFFKTAKTENYPRQQ